MKKRFLVWSLWVLAIACGGSPSAPSSGASAGYDGQWSGTTFQGARIAFTVTGQKVTAITLGYNFNGCSGTHSFANLSLDSGTPPNTGAPTLGPGFGYGSGNPEAGNYTQILGNFTSSSQATGSVIFGSYSGCGTAISIWNATRQ
jgi:hypothetical protein